METIIIVGWRCPGCHDLLMAQGSSPLDVLEELLAARDLHVEKCGAPGPSVY